MTDSLYEYYVMLYIIHCLGYTYYIFYYWWGGTKSLGTAATSGLLYKP
jgi:uncharacterized membrane protein (DUF4010 family)